MNERKSFVFSVVKNRQGFVFHKLVVAVVVDYSSYCCCCCRGGGGTCRWKTLFDFTYMHIAIYSAIVS